MTLAIAILVAISSIALLALLRRGRRWRRWRRAHASAREDAAGLAEAVAALATVMAFTLTVERDGRYTTATALGALHAWLGFDDDETTPREAWRLLVHPDDRPVVEQALRQALGGEPVECDVRYVPARGEPRRLRLGLRPVRDRWGWVHAIHGVLRERPERPEAEAERRQLDEQVRTRAAEASASAAVLDSVFANAPLPMVYLDRDFRLVRVNPAATRRLGVPAEAIQGRHAGDAAPDIWRRLGEHCRVVLDEGRPVDAEVTLHGTHGERAEARTYLASIFPVRGPDGTVTGVGAFANDITERKRFEEAVQASERYLSDLADAMPQIVYILGPDLRCEFVNRRFAEYTGRPDGARETLHDALLAAVHPDDWTEVRPRVLAAMEAGTAHAHEVRLREAATGHYRWFLLRTVPQAVADGRVTRWFGTATDIHEQKRIQRALQYAETRQRALADAAVRVTESLSLTKPLPETLRLVADLGREVVGAREARLDAVPTPGGYALGIEARAADLPEGSGGVPALAEHLRREVERSAAPRRLGRDEAARCTVEGAPVPSGAIAVPIVGRDGRVLGVLQFADRGEGEFSADDEAVAVHMAAMASVALENSELMQRIREGDQRKDEFLATLAHELRNPLAPIANSLELLRHAEQDEQVLQRARGTMERQMGQMVHLIDDLLDASRITSGKLALRRRRVALQELVAHALEATRPALERAEQVLEVVLPEAPVWLDADPTRLTQVFSNLLDNAAKFSEPGGRVTVTATLHANDVAVLVRDTGVGIPPEQLATVFDMFAQGDRSVERSAGGLGIGLALARGLVEMHGGRLAAWSEGTGHGTEMRVTLPLAAGAAASAEVPERPVPRAHRRILVADDNHDSADSLVSLLQMAGHEAHAVYDGASAVEAAAALQPDVVLLDLGMPRVSGHEAAQRIREGPARGAALVALTGWGDERARQRTREEGFDAHLTKPVDFRKLLEVLDHA